MASNAFTIADEDGDFEDWIELYNGTDSIINLKNYTLSDKLSAPDKWTFPEVLIYPDAFLLVFASGKDRQHGPYLHTNFKISIDGEYLLIADSSGQLLDLIAPVVSSTDNSYGRFPDGSDDLVFFTGSSPGYSNNDNVLYEPYLDTIYFSHGSGFFESSFLLDISNLDTNATIFYTLNGSEPNTSSLIFANPLLIEDRTSNPNSISTIPTNTDEAQHPYYWKPPSGNILKGTVLKARAFIDTIAVSNVYAATFLVNNLIYDRYNNLPVISIITDSLNLFGYETGIYIPGKMHDDNPNHPDWWGYGNYFGRGMEWERPAHLFFFEGSGNLAFSQKMGIRIHGGSSRALPLKSLRLYARNLYGKNQINYMFFPWKNVNNYRRINLRSGGSDFPYNMFADALSSLVTREFNMEQQDYRPSVLFMNGEFWGIHNIRDRIDEYYFEYSFGIPEEEIDYMVFWDYATIGDAGDFLALTNYLKKNNIVDEHVYNYVAERVDIDNFIDYIISKQYLAVYDWPGNNVNIWRHRTNNGKWRWISYDNDQSFLNYQFDAIAHSTLEGGTSWPNPDMSTFFIRTLFKNKTFQQQYLEKFAFHLEHSFDEARINNIIDSILDMIAPVIPEHINRWQYPQNLNTWHDNVQKMRDFVKYRPCFLKLHLYEYFNINDSTYLSDICVGVNLPIFPVLPILRDDKTIFTYPNPVRDNLSIVFYGFDDRAVQCLLYDMTGRRLFENTFQINEKNLIHISLEHFAKGIYILELLIDNEVQHKKIILE